MTPGLSPEAREIIARLQLSPHPEGGWYRQTWAAAQPASPSPQAAGAPEPRPCATAIYYLLEGGARSHWHRVDAEELWLYPAGAPLELRLAAADHGPAERQLLGTALAEAAPQCLVPADHWQSARSLGDFTLVSCIVAPGFRFSGFTLAEAGFDIPGPDSGA